MTGETIVITADALARVLFPLLYATIFLFAAHFFSSQLSQVSRRLAYAMLLAQALMIGRALYVLPRSSYETWLWSLHDEWNIPTTFAAMQLATIGAVALSFARQVTIEALWKRGYYFVLGILFIAFAVDEFFVIHEFLYQWQHLYITLGALTVLATVIVAARSPRNERHSYVGILAGLAIGALGAFVVESRGVICGDFAILTVVDCPQDFNWLSEELLELAGMWLVLVSLLAGYSAVIPIAGKQSRSLYGLPPLIVLILLLLQGIAIRPIEQQSQAKPAAVSFESGVRLHGYQVLDRRSERPLTVNLWLSQADWDDAGLGYSLHLVDLADGTSIAGRDKFAHMRYFLPGPGRAGVFRQWTTLDVPASAPPNRGMHLLLVVWREKDGDFADLAVIESDLPQAGRQIILDETVFKSKVAEPPAARVASFENGFSVISAQNLEQAMPGQRIPLQFTWYADNGNDSRDYVQFLHLIHAESGEWLALDRRPLGERLPTRLWYARMLDRETWQVDLPLDLAAGIYEIYTGLYRASDRERLPAFGQAGSRWLDDRVPLGEIRIEQSE